MTGLQAVGIGVIPHIGDALEPATVKLAEHALNIPIHRLGDIHRIDIVGFNVVVHGPEITDGIQHHPTHHEGNQNQ